MQEEVAFLNDYVETQQDFKQSHTESTQEAEQRSDSQNDTPMRGFHTITILLAFNNNLIVSTLVLPCILSAKLNKIKPWQIALNIVKMAES